MKKRLIIDSSSPCEKSRKGSSLEAQKKLFEDNMSLVRYVYSHNFYGFPDYEEDLLQEGYLALWKACLMFDNNRGVQFSTYAVTSIWNSMYTYVNSFIAKHSSVISLDIVVAEDGEGRELYLYDVVGKEENPLARYIIQDALQKMTLKEQQIIHELMKGYTQEDIAEKFCTSQSKVCRTLMKFKGLTIKEKESWQS